MRKFDRGRLGVLAAVGCRLRGRTLTATEIEPNVKLVDKKKSLEFKIVSWIHPSDALLGLGLLKGLLLRGGG